MAYIRRSRVPDTFNQFELNNFSGGMNNQSHVIEDNESPFPLNMYFADDTTLRKRKGTELFDNTDLPDSVTHMKIYYPYTDDPIIMRSSDSSLYAGDTSIQTVQGDVDSDNFSGRFFFVDGDSMYVYGKYPQSESTYVNISGDVVDEYLVFKVVNPPSGFIPLGEEHTQGVMHYDYNGNQVWYEPCENELDDEFKGANVIPENPKYIVAHNGRLYVSGVDGDDDNVFITDLQNPFYFPVTHPIQPTPNADRVVGLAVYDSAVIIGRKHDLHALIGDTNRTYIEGADVFRLKKLNSHTGFMNNNVFSVVHNYLFFLGSDGVVYNMSSINQSEHILSTSVTSVRVDLMKEPLGFSMNEMSKATSIFHDGGWYLSIADKILVYSYRHRSWTFFSGLNVRSFLTNEQDLLMGNTNGRTITFSTDDNYLDQGAPYMARWVSKNFNMGSSSVYKYFRDFFLVCYVHDELPSDVRVQFEIDNINYSLDEPIKNEMSLWGKSHWGDRFITRNITTSYPIVVSLRGRYIRFILSNSWDVQSSVYALAELESVEGTVAGETLVYVELEDAYYLYNQEREWTQMSVADFNQPMHVYEINGDYSVKGKR